jgi:hypothetical protein
VVYSTSETAAHTHTAVQAAYALPTCEIRDRHEVRQNNANGDAPADDRAGGVQTPTAAVKLLVSSLRNKGPGLSGRPPCRGVAVGVARRHHYGAAVLMGRWCLCSANPHTTHTPVSCIARENLAPEPGYTPLGYRPVLCPGHHADWPINGKGGIRSVRSPLRRAPLLATPIATPLQGGRPKRPGLLFLKILAAVVGFSLCCCDLSLTSAADDGR